MANKSRTAGFPAIPATRIQKGDKNPATDEHGAVSDTVACRVAVIPYKFPTLNEYVNACRAHRMSGANMKKEVERHIAPYLKKLAPLPGRAFVRFTWLEANKRRDMDNVAFAQKFVLDALVGQGILPNDNSKHVAGFAHHFVYGDKWGLVLELLEEADL